MSIKQGLYHLIPAHGTANDNVEDDAIQLTKHTARRKIFCFVVFCVVLILLVLIGVGLALHFTVFKKNDRNSNCITPDVCNSNVLNYIDDNIDPCNDFYGNWLAANPLDDRSVRGTFYSLSLDNYDQLMGYLSQAVRDDDPTAIKKTKYMYSACKNVDYIGNNILNHLQEFIRSAGGWRDAGIEPDNGWNINDSLARNHYLGSSAFFGFGVTPDDFNSSKPIIRVSRPALLQLANYNYV